MQMRRWVLLLMIWTQRWKNCAPNVNKEWSCGDTGNSMVTLPEEGQQPGGKRRSRKMSWIRDMLRALKKGAPVGPSPPLPVVGAAEDHHHHHNHQQPPTPLLSPQILQSTTSLSTESSTGSRRHYSLGFPTHNERTNRALVPSRCDPHRNLERGRLRGCTLRRSLLRNHRLVDHCSFLFSATSEGRRDQ